MKPKKCKHCAKMFKPQMMGQKVCGPACAIAYARTAKEEAQLKENRRVTRERREDRKTISELKAEAQAAFNRYIRVRDKGRGCISCGRTNAGQFHAGHYRTRAAAPHLAYNSYNCHLQCAQCNHHMSGNIVEYRLNLARRIGDDRLQWLESCQEGPRITKEYCRRVKQVFSRRAKHLAKLRDAINARAMGRVG